MMRTGGSSAVENTVRGGDFQTCSRISAKDSNFLNLLRCPSSVQELISKHAKKLPLSAKVIVVGQAMVMSLTSSSYIISRYAS